MKLIHLISGGDVGGAKTHVLSLLQGLNRTEDVHLICFMEGPFAEEARCLGIPTTVIEGSNPMAVRKRILAIIRHDDCQLLHCHGARANMIGALVQRQARIPVISTIHSDYRLDYLGRPLAALTYGDLLMLLHNQTRPYEKEAGTSRKLVDDWTKKLTDMFAKEKGYSAKEMETILPQIAEDFANVPVTGEKKVRVGVVGEIYVKYSPIGNNDLEEFLFSQNCETMVPGLLGFMLFKVDNRMEDIKLFGGSKAKFEVVKILFDYLVGIESHVIRAVEHANTVSNRFTVPSSYAHLKKLITGVIGYGCKMGEGWLLTAEMMELIESGYPNIICAQPFGCLPNHIVGKGMIRSLKNLYPKSNIVPIDYDPGATKVNQENRIKLMLAVAKENMEQAEKENAPKAEE